jgi:hypothetical protein
LPLALLSSAPSHRLQRGSGTPLTLVALGEKNKQALLIEMVYCAWLHAKTETVCSGAADLKGLLERKRVSSGIDIQACQEQGSI